MSDKQTIIDGENVIILTDARMTSTGPNGAALDAQMVEGELWLLLNNRNPGIVLSKTETEYLRKLLG